MGRAGTSKLDGIIEDAASKIQRLEPHAAHGAACDEDALIVDIRSHWDRARDGIVPGAVHIPRTVFEWRMTPDCEWRNPLAADPDRQTIVICNHGFASVIAAATLADLGYRQPGDVLGGFEAWRAGDLPIHLTAPEPPPSAQLDGMGPPDPGGEARGA